MQNYVSGKISGETRTRETGPAERALRDGAVRRSGPEHSHFFEFEDHLRPVRTEHLDGVLVPEVIAPLHGIENVRFDAVILMENGVESALSRPAVRTGGIDLAQNRHIGTARCVEGRHEPRQPSSDYQHFMAFHFGLLLILCLIL